MNILLIGHSIVDHIEKDGKKLVYPGGIFYSLSAMQAIKNGFDEIFLLTGLHVDYSDLFSVYLDVKLDYSDYINAMPEVFLRVFEDREREEIYKNISSNLSLDKIKEWDYFDGILINMITGYDISLEQLQKIRKSFKGLIYFDVHTLSRGINYKMKREFRPIPDVEKWLENIDMLQCNENEIKTIFDLDEFKAVEKIIECGTNIVLVTKGDKGATAYSKAGSALLVQNIPAEKVNAVNKIGCGDVFGAVFFYSYLRTGFIEDSLKTANKAAGFSVANHISDNPGLLKSFFNN